MTHDLKTHPEPFAAIFEGRKKHEFRKDDRVPRFEVGDVLRLREFDPEVSTYSGRRIEAVVTYLMRGPAYGIPEGYCCMSISRELLFAIDKVDDCCGYSE